MVTIFDSVGATLLSLDLSNLNYLEYIPEEHILDVQFSGDASYPCPVLRGFFVPTTSALDQERTLARLEFMSAFGG